MKTNIGNPNDFATLVQAASSGDADSVKELISIYAPYIRKLATIPLYDAAGNTYYALDTEKQHQLEMDLIISTMKFIP